MTPMRTVLVVDDMALFRDSIGVILRTNGFHVTTASNGVEALVAIANHRPDLVLLDLGMPQMGGMAVLRELRSREATAALPVIVLTVEGDRACVHDVIACGISGYILKSSFSASVVLERVNNAFSSFHPTGRQGVGAGARPRHDRRPVPHPGIPGSDGSKGPSTRDGTSIEDSDASPAAPRVSGGPSVRAPLTTENAIGKLPHPILSRSELVERLQAEGELRGFSPTIQRIIEMTNSDQCSLEQIGQAVSQDPTVSLRIVRLANSSVYSRGDRVDSIQKAVLRIGVQGIRSAALSIGLVERFGSVSCEQYLIAPLFWEHCIACGTIAAELARLMDHKDSDRAFLAGLLHDTGKLIFANQLGEPYGAVLETASALETPLEDVESRLLGMDHAKVMEHVLRTWQFPKELVAPIALHHETPERVKRIAPKQVAEVLRLGLADRLAHALLLGHSGNDFVYPTAQQCRLLGVDADHIRQIEEMARRSTDEAKLALLSGSSAAAWESPIKRLRAQLGSHFRPLFLGTNPEMDAFRILCDTLRDTTPGLPPNVIVVHLSGAGDYRRLSQELLSAGHAAKLPMVVMSPHAALSLEDEAMAGRHVVHVSTPLHVPSFVRRLRELLEQSATPRAA